MSNFICSVCKNQKHTLRRRKSKLMPNLVLNLCDTCFNAKLEPRFAVIMAGRTNGLESVSDYLKNHRYPGNAILAEEMF